MYSKKDLKDPAYRLEIYELTLKYVKDKGGPCYICLFINHGTKLLDFDITERNMRFHLPELWNARNKEYIKEDKEVGPFGNGGLFESRIERITVLEKIINELEKL